MGEAIGFAITIFGALIAVYTQTQIRLTTLELRMTEKEKSDQVIVEQLDKLNSKLDKMQLDVFDIKLEVQKKADKK
jgi:hypothetical protein